MWVVSPIVLSFISGAVGQYVCLVNANGINKDKCAIISRIVMYEAMTKKASKRKSACAPLWKRVHVQSVLRAKLRSR